ncbi:MAG TPA: WYL domain-containing protein, partial [Gammaproteobacteria bacterium]|nr:WYL domain-containing protein [Gammaproteobacteria bacterium]
QWLDDGRYELRLPYHRHEELLGDILKYGAEVEVTAPAVLRAAVRRELKEMSEIYK